MAEPSMRAFTLSPADRIALARDQLRAIIGDSLPMDAKDARIEGLAKAIENLIDCKLAALPPSMPLILSGSV